MNSINEHYHIVDHEINTSYSIIIAYKLRYGFASYKTTKLSLNLLFLIFIGIEITQLKYYLM